MIYPESQNEWIRTWSELRKRSCAEAKWLHSFYEPSSGKMYCQWDALDYDTIVACLGSEILEIAPIEYSSEIVMFDPAWLDEADRAEGERA
jgi:hypothetical protein